MEMFIDAIKERAELDMLFYVPTSVDTSPSSVSRLQESLSAHWQAETRLTLCPREERKRAPSRWEVYGAGALSFFRQQGHRAMSGPRQVDAFEQCLSRKPELLFVHRLGSMCPVMLTRHDLPPVYLDLDDLEHVAFVRRIGQPPTWPAKLLYYLQVPALLWAERRAIRLARQTYVCSNIDRDYLTRRWRLSGVVAVPNAVAVPEPLPLPSEPTLLFLGTYSYEPNVAAAEFLVDRVWPLVRQAVPQARLILAGPSPERIRSYGRRIPGIEYTGFVEDLSALYARVRVVCSPIFSGGGTRFKIVEAAAHGRPVVATRLGAEGLDMQDGREILLHDDAEAFSDACVHLLQDRQLCGRLGAAARQLVVRDYERENVVRLIQHNMFG
jgi:glycosyltransferase involved in cell wall biosynthesis